MILKRILAALVAASIISTGVFAYTPYGPEPTPETQESQSSEQAKNQEETESSAPSLEHLDKGSYQYRMFRQILDLYVEKHLYDFTQEDVLYKFFEDFLAQNPMYFSYFMKYMLGTMDKYSSYYDASSNFLEPDSVSAGFGFMIKDDGDGVFIDTVIKESNANEAGFQAGDKFVSIAGVNVEHQSFDVVTALLARPETFMAQKNESTSENGENTTDTTDSITKSIDITVDRNGEKLTLSIEKGPMRVSQISSTIDDNDGYPTAYIEVLSFLGENTDTEFIELVNKYAKDGIKHLTIDLRNNGGGSLDYALSMVETFLDEGEIISYYNDKTLSEPQAILSTTPKTSFDSITILINENTASAAELFTSILHDKGIAKVVGTKSFGKSLGQEVYTLANGDFITITTYQILNESLESYDGIGLIPDLVIEDVEMCYTLPPLGVFNYINYTEVEEGKYSDVTKALEDRMVVMGILRDKYSDGIFDDVTKNALFVLQKEHGVPATGYLNQETVSLITRLINAHKSKTYYDNTQYEVAMIVHHSFSQGKRLVKEKGKLREEHSLLIEQRDAALESNG